MLKRYMGPVKACGLLALLLMSSASAQMQNAASSASALPLGAQGIAQAAGGVQNAMGNAAQTAAGFGSAMSTAVQNAMGAMPGAQMAANALQNAFPGASAFRAAAVNAMGGAAAQSPTGGLPQITLPLATAPLSFPFISEAQATVNNAVQWAAGLPAAGMQVASGVAQSGISLMNSIPAGVAAALDGPNAASRAARQVQNQIPALGTEINRATEGSVAVATGVLGMPRANLQGILPTLPAMSPMMAGVGNAIRNIPQNLQNSLPAANLPGALSTNLGRQGITLTLPASSPAAEPAHSKAAAPAPEAAKAVYASTPAKSTATAPAPEHVKPVEVSTPSQSMAPAPAPESHKSVEAPTPAKSMGTAPGPDAHKTDAHKSAYAPAPGPQDDARQILSAYLASTAGLVASSFQGLMEFKQTMAPTSATKLEESAPNEGDEEEDSAAPAPAAVRAEGKPVESEAVAPAPHAPTNKYALEMEAPAPGPMALAAASKSIAHAPAPSKEETDKEETEDSMAKPVGKAESTTEHKPSGEAPAPASMKADLAKSPTKSAPVDDEEEEDDEESADDEEEVDTSLPNRRLLRSRRQ
eukprot:jgi/Botrbrau1/2781/Bobra.0164s0058.1